MNPAKINLQSFCTPELQLLIAIIQKFTFDKEELKINDLITENLKWDSFINHAKKHRIIPVVNKIISSNHHVPQSVRSQLFQFSIRNSIKNKLYTEELFQLSDKLADNNIEAIPMCGAFLALEYYKDLSLRTFVDLDLMVHTKDVLKVKDILNSNDYREFHPMAKHDETKIFKNGYEHTVIKKIPKIKGSVLFELHWNLLNRDRIELPVSLKDFENGIIKREIQGRTMHCFDTETTLLINLIDGGVKDLWFPMKHLVDLSIIIKRNNEIDWGKMLERMEEFKFKKLYLLGFYLIDQLFGQDLPQLIKHEILKESKLKKMALTIMKSYQRSKPFNSLVRLKLCLDCMPDTAQKIKFSIKYISSYLSPKKHDYAHLHLPKYLSFLYFFVRIKRVFIKQTR